MKNFIIWTTVNEPAAVVGLESINRQAERGEVPVSFPVTQHGANAPQWAEANVINDGRQFGAYAMPQHWLAL